MNLDKFFKPKSAAFIGATPDLNKFGGRCFRRMAEFGFTGNIYPINPKYTELFGRACFPNIAALPEVPDHVGIVLPAEKMLGALKECIALGVPFATLYSSGFSEDGSARGRELQQQLIDTARAGNLRFMGPNCNGFVSFVNSFCMTTTSALAGPKKPVGNIGIVAQSGGVGQVSVMYRAHELGLGISHQVSCGNQADIDVLDFTDFMVSDPSTQVILMAIESLGQSLGNTAKLQQVSQRALQAGKPIVVLKLGRTESGKKAVASHTGAITGSDAVCDAAFRQFSLIRVNEACELLSMAMLLRQGRWPRSRQAAAMSMSGGHSAIFADLGDAMGIQWPAYSAATLDVLATVLPAFGVANNPTDITGVNTGNAKAYSTALHAIASDPAVDSMIPIFTIAKADEINMGADFVLHSPKPAAILWTGGCSDDATLTPRNLVERGVPVFRDILPCLRAFDAAMNFGRSMDDQAKNLSAPAIQRPVNANREQAIAKLKSFNAGSLSERASREVLVAYGFESTKGGLARNVEEVVQLAAQLPGAAVLKIDSPDIAHKTEAGGVRLNLQGAAAITAAFEQIMTSARAYQPDARINGVLVQELAPSGIEMILGVSRDVEFGPVITVGLGGIHVEVLKDVVHRIAPVNELQAEQMLRELRAFKILEGVRGAPPRDMAALIAAIVRLSWFAHELRDEIAEVDINPLLVLEQGNGVCMLDALLVRHQEPS